MRNFDPHRCPVGGGAVRGNARFETVVVEATPSRQEAEACI
jgi:hypothetical protein